MPQKTLTNPTPFAFIPCHLAIKDRPDLNVFPLNIMFMSLANIQGVDASGTSLYEPDLTSYRKNKRNVCMRYYNKYCNKDYINITYYFDKHNYEGTKYIKGKKLLTAHGKDWKTFFIHLTMNGLCIEEECKFKPIKDEM